MPDRRAWGKLSELLKPIFLDYRNLPMHVIFIAQERTLSEEDEVTVEHVPDLSPGSRGVATGAVDIIGRVFQREVRVASKKKGKEVKKWQTRLLVGPHDEYTTKDRTGALGRIMNDPTVPKMLAAMNAEEE
jgi:hypothetical protein